MIPNYGERYRYGETISTAFVESTVNEVIAKRMVKKQQMQWSHQGASGQFYASDQFHKRDINHIAQMLKITTSVQIDGYNESTRKHHRKLILDISSWRLATSEDNENLNTQAKWYIRQQLSPQKVLGTLVEFCWNQHIVIPSYSKISEIITQHYNDYEDGLLATLKHTLSQYLLNLDRTHRI
jgi:hypothetical protein